MDDTLEISGPFFLQRDPQIVTVFVVWPVINQIRSCWSGLVEKIHLAQRSSPAQQGQNSTVTYKRNSEKEGQQIFLACNLQFDSPRSSLPFFPCGAVSE